MGKKRTSTRSRELRHLSQQRWAKRDARRVLKAWRESGLSMMAFGRLHGIRGQRLSWWKNRLRDWSSGGSEAPTAKADMPLAARFVPAVVRQENDSEVVVRTGNGLTIEVKTALVAPQWLATLLDGITRNQP